MPLDSAEHSPICCPALSCYFHSSISSTWNGFTLSEKQQSVQKVCLNSVVNNLALWEHKTVQDRQSLSVHIAELSWVPARVCRMKSPANLQIIVNPTAFCIKCKVISSHVDPPEYSNNDIQTTLLSPRWKSTLPKRYSPWHVEQSQPEKINGIWQMLLLSLNA